MTKEAFAEVVLDSTDSLYRVAKGILKNDSDCEDAVWEAIGKGVQNLPALRQEQYAKTWLIRILIHECYRVRQSWQHRADWKEKEDMITSGKLEWQDGNYDAERDRQEEYGELYEALHKLEEKYRLPLILFYVDGYSVREIAVILESTENTVKSWLARGREKLRGIMEVDRG